MAEQTLPTHGGFEAKAPSVYTPRKVGAAHTLEYRVFIEKNGVPVPPFSRRYALVSTVRPEIRRASSWLACSWLAEGSVPRVEDVGEGGRGRTTL